MPPDSQLRSLMADVHAVRERIAIQTAKDPDHMVALAMFNQDLKRALARVSEYEASNGRRTYTDGRRVA